jgi:hypothetical protein
MNDRPIQIEGLSPVQMEMANRMWALDDIIDVDNYINMMPKRLRGQARLVREMMIAAALDQYEGDVDLAKSVIDSVK